MDDGRPRSHAVAHVAPHGAELVFVVDTRLHGRCKAVKHGTRRRIRPIARLGRVAGEDALVTIPELNEDGRDRGGGEEDAA